MRSSQQNDIDQFFKHIFPSSVQIFQSKGLISIKSKYLDIARLYSLSLSTENKTRIWLLPKEFIDPKLKTLFIKVGDLISISEFIKKLVEECGYSKVDSAYDVMQFMQRGDSITIFTNMDGHIIQVEFYDRVIESISELDYANLRKIGSLDSCVFINLQKENLSFEPECIAMNSFRSYDSETSVVIFDDDHIEENQYILDLPFFRSNAEIFQRYLHQLNQTNAIQKIYYQGQTDLKDLPRGFQSFNDIKVIKISLDIQLERGLFFSKLGVVVLTDREITSKINLTKAKSKFSSKFKKLFDHEIKVGEYVVHEAHGVGVYAGIETKLVGNEIQDYVVINYKNDDRLLIPTHQLHRISKYLSADGSAPKLTRLGKAEWSIVTRKLKKSVEDIAKDLLAIYAKKSLQKGFVFNSESELDRKNINSSFPYPLTVDQIKTLNEVYEDMESEKPMDRLIIGDVGFGKTEIAIRAAFKAVCNKKQVLVIAPTTILVTQLYEVFCRRLEPLGVGIARISRFDGNKNNKNNIQNANKGLVDILIGTHRLLSKDVELKNLGLLIIDEEQRFGVKQKERIRSLRTEIDLLSMSATPIPRTLQMALTGIKDISIIATPPQNRKPVQTQIAFNDEIEVFIRREIERGGQVFIVHNRVETIEKVVADLQSLLGDKIRVICGHGKMDPVKLEKVMYDFSQRKFDILVATTIIENGIDIPAVNTIIISDAHKFGVSQLYQLRGRVGRSDVKAYCYLVVPKSKEFIKLHRNLNKDLIKLKNVLLEDKNTDDWVSSESVERIKAIVENQELGAGFKIASRDLEIRGSGNILGSEQSGYINAVGYEMFVRLLEQEIDKIRKNATEVQSS